MKYLCLLLFGFAALLSPLKISAQTENPEKRTIDVIQDEKITRLETEYKKINAQNASFDGYRVQIFFDSGNNSKQSANTVLAKFTGKYPNYKGYVSYKEPYYRVRVGNFRTLSEAVSFQKKIAADYPSAFPVMDELRIEDINY